MAAFNVLVSFAVGEREALKYLKPGWRVLLDSGAYTNFRTGKDVVTELQARLPRMKKADVDRAVRKYLGMDGLTIAIVAGVTTGQPVADTLMNGGPTGITYDTAGTPAEVMAEDDLIKRFPVPIEKDNVSVVPVDKMFEK